MSDRIFKMSFTVAAFAVVIVIAILTRGFEP